MALPTSSEKGKKKSETDNGSQKRERQIYCTGHAALQTLCTSSN